MDTMLSKALREFTTGPLNQLIVNIGGPNSSQWENELKRFLRKEPCWTNDQVMQAEGPNIIKIDRSIPFDPVTFFDKGCLIEEQDERALVLTEFDLNNVRLETMFKPGETYVNGKERLKRLKMAGHIRLDAKVFQTLWENKHLIPEKWKEETNGNTIHISFNGTVLWDSHGNRFVLDLCWDGDGGEWFRNYDWLDSSLGANHPSAVLES